MIKKRIFIKLILICFLTLFVTACGSSDEEVVAKINDRTITNDQFSQYYFLITGTHPDSETSNKEAKAVILDNIVQLEVMKEYMVQNNIPVDESVIEKQYNDYVESLKENTETQKFFSDNNITNEFLKRVMMDQFYAEKFNEKVIEDIEDTEAAVQEYYESHEDEFVLNQVRASHILVKTKEEAEDIQKKIQAGEDFAELAQQYSIDGSAQVGGDLDYFSRGKMVQPFEEAAFALEVNEVSDIVESEFGFHIIKLTDKMEGLQPLEKIYDQVLNAMYNDVIQKNIDDIMTTMTIEKYPEKLS